MTLTSKVITRSVTWFNGSLCRTVSSNGEFVKVFIQPSSAPVSKCHVMTAGWGMGVVEEEGVEGGGSAPVVRAHT